MTSSKPSAAGDRGRSAIRTMPISSEIIGSRTERRIRSSPRSPVVPSEPMGTRIRQVVSVARTVAGGELALAFPNASYVVGRAAWERALAPHPRDRASFIPGLCELMQATGGVERSASDFRFATRKATRRA